jgi:hypothetical protein
MNNTDRAVHRLFPAALALCRLERHFVGSKRVFNLANPAEMTRNRNFSPPDALAGADRRPSLIFFSLARVRARETKKSPRFFG